MQQLKDSQTKLNLVSLSSRLDFKHLSKQHPLLESLCKTHTHKTSMCEKKTAIISDIHLFGGYSDI